LAGCAALHTLELAGCGVTDLSGLAGCTTLHTLNLQYCYELTDVSALANCAALHTLDLSESELTDVSAIIGSCKRSTFRSAQD